MVSLTRVSSIGPVTDNNKPSSSRSAKAEIGVDHEENREGTNVST